MREFPRSDGGGFNKLRYVSEDLDKRGNVRLYFRMRGRPKVRLRSKPGTKEFEKEYQNALSGKVQTKLNAPMHASASRHQIQSLCEAYYRSLEFRRLAHRTQRVRQGILSRFCQKFGKLDAREMSARHVRDIRARYSDKPGAGNALLKALRQVFQHAVEMDILDRNVLKDVAYISYHTDGFHAWTPEEIKQFEETHTVGSMARLAFALLYFTGQRRADVVSLGRQHIKEGSFKFTQVKNRNRNPVSLSIPVIPDENAGGILHHLSGRIVLPQAG